MNNKSRKVKEFEYNQKYSHIPIDYNERLDWMYNEYKITDKKSDEIIKKRYEMLSSLYYKDITIMLFEEPEGAKRPRTRLINKQNFANAAMSNSQFIHIYSPNAKEDNVYMQKLVGQEIIELNELICTPCIVEYNTYVKTPNVFNTTDIFLSEVGLIRPLNKPDWDNIGKKYSDMSNQNIWLDDTLVVSGTVNKYYSILPRIEIKIRFLNTLYNKYQYNALQKRTEQELDYFGRIKL